MGEGRDRSGVRPALAGGLIAAAAAFVLAGYELLRTPTNTLFVTAFGKERLPMVTALIPVAVLLFTYGYARLLSWLGPRRTLAVTTLGSAAAIAIGWAGWSAGLTWVLWPLFLLREAYVVLIIEQYWSFINSTLTVADARKLNGPICGIASLGSIAAGVVGSQITTSVGTTTMILLAAVATLPAAAISAYAYRRCGEPQEKAHAAAAATAASEGKRTDHLALSTFRQEPVLPWLLLIVVATQVVSTVLGLAFQGVLQDTYPAVDQQSAYSYGFYAWVNGGAAVLQFIAAPLVMQFVAPSVLHVLMPLLHLAACALYLRMPGLPTIAFAFAAFKCVDYSLFRAAKEVLYIPLPFAARYRAKEVIDVFGYRTSKGLTSGVISLLHEGGVAFSEGLYAGIALVTAALWVGLAVPLGRHYRERVHLPDTQATVSKA